MQAKGQSGNGLFRGESASATLGDAQVNYRRMVKAELLRNLSSSTVELSIETVAENLNLPVRTLQRRLTTYGVTFRELLDECRHKKACEMLKDRRLPISEIGKHLGYSDPAHFARAFRRWSDHSPSDFRNQKAPSSC